MSLIITITITTWHNKELMNNLILYFWVIFPTDIYRSHKSKDFHVIIVLITYTNLWPIWNAKYTSLPSFLTPFSIKTAVVVKKIFSNQQSAVRRLNPRYPSIIIDKRLGRDQKEPQIKYLKYIRTTPVWTVPIRRYRSARASNFCSARATLDYIILAL